MKENSRPVTAQSGVSHHLFPLCQRDLEQRQVIPRLSRKGFMMMVVLGVGTVLLVLGVTLHSFVSRQNVNVHNLTFAEIAHFLAEAGLGSSLRNVREAVTQAGLISSENNPLYSLLTQPAPLPDTSLMSMLKDTWNNELAAFAKDLDDSADIRVEVWLRGFSQSETDPSRWVDPVAKTGWLAIESTGTYRGRSRTLTVRRQVSVASCLPPVTSKFTLHVRDAAQGKPGIFNLIRNDYQGNITDGPKPLICLNHSTPESPLESRSIAQILDDDGREDIYLQRGWIWLGGGPTKLHITSGAGQLGEIFHFYDVSNPNTFQPVNFSTQASDLPAIFAAPVSLLWDKLNVSQRQVSYNFRHLFLFDGFHDRSAQQTQDAMYQAGILSDTDKSMFGAKSSILHLFGEARKGFQSRTKVFGKVAAVFPKFAFFDIQPQDSDVAQMFAALPKSPLYFLRSVPAHLYSGEQQINCFPAGRFGGPILSAGMLFKDYQEYRRHMSAIVEQPYVHHYNIMQDVAEKQSLRRFPPTKTILSEDQGDTLQLKRDNLLIYQGPVSAPGQVEIVNRRVQVEVDSIADFWEQFYDAKENQLVLSVIVRIRNEEKKDFLIPPPGGAAPLKIKGRGMVILEQGNLGLRGVQAVGPFDALTIVLNKGKDVFFQSPTPNHVNIVAPDAEVDFASKVDLFGVLSVRTLRAESRSQGGALRFREAQDPTGAGYQQFYSMFVADKDGFWYE